MICLMNANSKGEGLKEFVEFGDAGVRDEEVTIVCRGGHFGFCLVFLKLNDFLFYALVDFLFDNKSLIYNC
jgi:hypothetical protein